MSAALNAAKKRRGVPPPSTPQFSQPTQAPPAPPAGGLTLQQVIQVIDKRLINLETFAKNNSNIGEKITTVQASNVPSNLTEVLEEYNSRFDILAEEIANLKNIVLNLQSYTMDVNKVLMKERIRILSGDGVSSSEQVDAETTTELDTETTNFSNLSLDNTSSLNVGEGATYNFYS